MPVTRAKICGLSTPEAVRAALDGDAAYLGFVFFDKSPRNLAPGAAAQLAAPARGPAKIVALTVDPTDAQLAQVIAALNPDLIQLHGNETPERAAAIRAVTGLPTIKALGVREAQDVARAKAYEGAVDHLMFDAKPPTGADRPGGHGAAFDWGLLE